MNKNGKLFINNKNNIFVDNNNIFSPQKIIPVKINQDNNIQSDEVIDSKKNINSEEYVFDDGLDEIDYIGNKINFISIFKSKKFIGTILIFIFIFVTITVYKAFYYKGKIDHYEEVFLEIENILDDSVKVYNGPIVDSSEIEKGAANKLVECINSPLDNNNLPDSINSIIKEINSFYNQSYNYFSFKYVDIYTGFTVSYNENQNIFTASTIKAPTDIYLYEMASQGKINLNDKIKYTNKYYNTGSGILKNKRFNEEYDIKTLLNYSIVYSDNAAHNMLMDKYGRENMLNFWKNLGTTAIFTKNSIWGVTNAHDAAIYMGELYDFTINNKSSYGDELLNNFLNTKTKFIQGKNGYNVANKCGWSGSTVHDAAIIFAENPYIVIALSNVGEHNNYMLYFNKVNDLAYKLHTEYWKTKMNMCNNINQF